MFIDRNALKYRKSWLEDVPQHPPQPPHSEPLQRVRRQVCKDVRDAFEDNLDLLYRQTKVRHSLLWLTLTYADRPDRKTVMSRIAQFRANELRRIDGRRWIVVHAFQGCGKIHHHFVIDTGVDLTYSANLKRIGAILRGDAMKRRFGRIRFESVYAISGLTRYMLSNWAKRTVPVGWGKSRCYSCGGARVTNADGSRTSWFLPVRK